MNIAILIGRLTREVELKQSASGNSYLSNTIAINRPRKNEDGTNNTDFINIKVFGKTAELLSTYFKKGDSVAVTGSIQTDSYVNNDGVTIYTTDVIVRELTFLPKSKTNENTENQTTIENNPGKVDFGKLFDTNEDGKLPF